MNGSTTSNRARANRSLIGAAVLLATLPAAAQAQVVGVNAAVHNKVSIRSNAAKTSRPAVLKDRVALNDEVQTQANSQLRVLLLDKSDFTVGANARVTIDRFVYDPARGTRSMGATVARGAFRFMSGRSSGAGSTGSTIKTPIASIGIRGTMVEGTVGAEAVRIAALEPAVGPGVRSDPATASLIILRGPGPNQQGNSRPGAIDVQFGNRLITLDRPMQALYLPGAGMAPIGPFTVSPSALSDVQILINPALAGKLSIAAALLGAARQGGSTGSGGGKAPSSGGNGGSSGGQLAKTGRFPLLAALGPLGAIIGVIVATQGSDTPASR
ncbi:MAG: hypothetical protein B7Y45_00450 [Sphingomonas sp. 28-66-16]|nr:MAG: hypothetical protein B7Y45_00450 [Sphingomonas sp. 28-66-16]